MVERSKSELTKIELVQNSIVKGDLKSLAKAVDIVSLTLLAKGTGVHFNTLKRKIKSPGLLKIDEIELIAGYFGLTPNQVFALAMFDKNNPRS